GEKLDISVDETYLSSYLAFHPSGNIFASAELSGRIQLLELCDIDLDHNHVRCVKRHTLIGHRAGVNLVRFSADGRFLASAGSDHIARVWDAATGETRHVLAGHVSALRAIDFAPTGETLVTGSSDGTIKLWNLDTGACINTLTFPGPYDGMNIYGATGLTPAQRQSLKHLGAIESA
ncbi:MAG: hypothetical protein KDE31_37355, partial [Caldilineaceae bacterium]|nr:hypothetical protein [Caldilineaceae bacterium]